MPSLAALGAQTTIESRDGVDSGVGGQESAYLPLLTANAIVGHTVLVAGYSHLTPPRIALLRRHGARVVCAFRERQDVDTDTLGRRLEEEGVRWIRREVVKEDLVELGRDETEGVVDAVYVTAEGSEKDHIAATIIPTCRRLRIPYNISDSPPSASSFTILSTHSSGPLHIGITASGQGCKLASRIRREIVGSLPKNIGEACTRLGQFRRRIIQEDEAKLEAAIDDEEDTEQSAAFNKLVLEADTSALTQKTRRIRWLSQMCEYYPLATLCSLSDDDLSRLLETYNTETSLPAAPAPQAGHISLIGSGPGDPGLLTVAARKAIDSADLILSDKLVPASILSTLPRRTPLFIARKYPGNAEQAQKELMDMALAALSEGKRVVRLKQGDPFLFGRGGEEVLQFRERGFEPTVVPGITSALSGPMFANIPVTHRATADGVLVVTGTGRKGVPPPPPEYVKNRTVVFLMALHRVEGLVSELVGNGWPAEEECAVVERASCPDQRVVRTTLGSLVEAVKECGSRPPGILVVGRACGVLRSRGTERWVVEES